MNNEGLNTILDEVLINIKNLYGKSLMEVFLYGSYARNQNSDESDIDILAIINMSDQELRQYEKRLNNIISDIGFRYNKMVALIDLSYEKFDYWSDVVPFYRNVKNEGVVIYEQ